MLQIVIQTFQVMSVITATTCVFWVLSWAVWILLNIRVYDRVFECNCYWIIFVLRFDPFRPRSRDCLTECWRPKVVSPTLPSSPPPTSTYSSTITSSSFIRVQYSPHQDRESIYSCYCILLCRDSRVVLRDLFYMWNDNIFIRIDTWYVFGGMLDKNPNLNVPSLQQRSFINKWRWSAGFRAVASDVMSTLFSAAAFVRTYARVCG